MAARGICAVLDIRLGHMLFKLRHDKQGSLI